MTSGNGVAGLLPAVERLADDVLWPDALGVDRSGRIPWSHFESLNQLGLFALMGPEELGGADASRSEVRSVLRTLGRGCGATAFAFAQHGGPVAALRRTANESVRQRWLPPFCGGALAGIAFAHLRRIGPPVLRATPIAGGWRIDGRAPWVTSWGTAAGFAIAAGTDDDRVVWSLIDGAPRPTLVPSEPMSLLAYSATATVELDFRGHRIPDHDVLEIVALDRWRIDDRRGAASPNPLCVGVGDRTLAELEAAAPDVAGEFGPWWHDLVDQAEAAWRSVDAATDDIDAVAAVRTEVVLGVQRLTTALLSVVGGRAMARAHAAQLLARQALFYVVQAQNDDGRRATVGRLSPRSEPGPRW